MENLSGILSWDPIMPRDVSLSKRSTSDRFSFSILEKNAQTSLGYIRDTLTQVFWPTFTDIWPTCTGILTHLHRYFNVDSARFFARYLCQEFARMSRARLNASFFNKIWASLLRSWLFIAFQKDVFFSSFTIVSIN